MLGNVTNRMEVLAASATKSEIKLMRELRNIEVNSLASMSITELAAELNVAESTISRFCKKLEYRGFQEFKLALMQDFGRDLSGTDGFHKKIAEKMTEAVNETCLGISADLCERIALCIIKAGKVCIFGTSNSSIAAGALRVKLLRTGINADSTADFHLQRVAVKNLTEKDFVILFSASGSTREMLELAKTAKERGVPITVVTNYDKSQLAEYAKYLLLSSRKEVLNDEVSLASVVAQLYVADVLGAAVENVRKFKLKKK